MPPTVQSIPLEVVAPPEELPVNETILTTDLEPGQIRITQTLSLIHI